MDICSLYCGKKVDARSVKKVAGYIPFNRHPVHRALKVKIWVKEDAARLLFVSLVIYSPEISPEALLIQDVKSHAWSRLC
jgi:hypothetical protein